MKILIVLFYLVCFKLSYSQTFIFGTYQLATSLAGETTSGTILRLNCDYTYYRSDSISQDWGKWEAKENGIFFLQIDTMSANGRTESYNAKVYYRLINQKLVLHEKEYSKKAFKEFISEANRSNTDPRFKIRYSDEIYEKYRLYSMNLYFEKKETFECK